MWSPEGDSGGLRATALRECGVHAFDHFFGGEVPLMRGDRPLVSEWIFDDAVAITPEHVVDRHSHLGAGFDHPRDESVDVGNI
jgi:hypothetical protein